MSEVKIKELDKSLIHQANSNSMSGKRDAIDRAAGRVAYLREVAAFEAGYGFMPE